MCDQPLRLLPGILAVEASWSKPTARRTTLQKKSEPQKERETKDDGRYIIFYTFEDEED